MKYGEVGKIIRVDTQWDGGVDEDAIIGFNLVRPDGELFSIVGVRESSQVVYFITTSDMWNENAFNTAGKYKTEVVITYDSGTQIRKSKTFNITVDSLDG